EARPCRLRRGGRARDEDVARGLLSAPRPRAGRGAGVAGREPLGRGSGAFHARRPPPRSQRDRRRGAARGGAGTPCHPPHPGPAPRAGATGRGALLLRAPDSERDRPGTRDLGVPRLAGAQPRDVADAASPPEGPDLGDPEPMSAAKGKGGTLTRAKPVDPPVEHDAIEAVRAGEEARGVDAAAARRRASRSLWAACEAFLSTAEPR